MKTPPGREIDASAARRGFPAGERRRVLAVVVAVVLGVGLVYGQTVWFGFTDYDDPLYVTHNSLVSRGLTPEGFAWAFTTDRASAWVPVTWLSLMLDAQLYGDSAGGYHLTNLVLHAACAVGLFLLLHGATGRTWPAAFAAALFAFHPLRVEAVAWVTARKDVLSGLFFMLTLWAYGRYVQRSSPARYGAVAVALTMGLMAKSMLVTMPVLLLLLDFWPLGRLREPRDLPRLTLEKLPLFAVSLVAAVVTVAVQGDSLVGDAHMTPAWRMGQATLAYVGYLGMFLWPANLAAAYPRPGAILPWPTVAVAAALLLGITLAAWRERRRHPYLIAGWLWYLVAFLPAIGLVQVGVFAMADRFTYLPLIGPVVALVWLAADLARTDSRAGVGRAGDAAPGPRSAGVVMVSRAAAMLTAVGILGGLAVASWRQATAWRGTETLWLRTLEHTTNNWFAHLSLAAELTKQRRYDEAEIHVRRALTIAPSHPLGLGGLAAIAARTDRRDEALDICRGLVATNPRDVQARTMLGSLLSRQSRHREALEQHQAALALSPDSVDAIAGLAEALLGCGEPRQALDVMLAGRRIWADHPLIARQLGRVLLAQGRAGEAVESLRRAVDHDPADGPAWNALGVATGQSGRLDESIDPLRRATEIEPGTAGFHRDLGFALALNGRFDDAAASYRRAIAIEPDNRLATNDLAWLLATCPDAKLRSADEAVALATTADRIAGGVDPTVLDTLAAAHAEAGQFAEAIVVARRALELAERRGDPRLAADIRAHVALFDAGKPVRHPPVDDRQRQAPAPAVRH